MDELDAFERSVAEKRQQQPTVAKTTTSTSTTSSSTGPDYLDEYLERLQINDNNNNKSCSSNRSSRDTEEEQQVAEMALPPPRYSFLRLLLLFMSIMSMAQLLRQQGHNGNGRRGDKLGIYDDIVIWEILFNFKFTRSL